MEELTVEQRTQAVIDLNKLIDRLIPMIPSMTQEEKEQLFEVMQSKRQQLGL